MQSAVCCCIHVVFIMSRALFFFFFFFPGGLKTRGEISECGWPHRTAPRCHRQRIIIFHTHFRSFIGYEELLSEPQKTSLIMSWYSTDYFFLFFFFFSGLTHKNLGKKNECWIFLSGNITERRPGMPNEKTRGNDLEPWLAAQPQNRKEKQKKEKKKKDWTTHFCWVILFVAAADCLGKNMIGSLSLLAPSSSRL